MIPILKAAERIGLCANRGEFPLFGAGRGVRSIVILRRDAGMNDWSAGAFEKAFPLLVVNIRGVSQRISEARSRTALLGNAMA